MKIFKTGCLLNSKLPNTHASHQQHKSFVQSASLGPRELGHSHIRDARPEWVSFPGLKPADGCKFLTKILRMGHNFDINLPGNRWCSSKLNKTYCSLANFCCK